MKTSVNFNTIETRKSNHGRFTFIDTAAGSILGAVLGFMVGAPVVCLGMGMVYGLWIGAAIDGAMESSYKAV